MSNIKVLASLVSLILVMACAKEEEIVYGDDLLKIDFESKESSLSDYLEQDLVSLQPKSGPDGSTALKVEYKGSRNGSKRVLAKIPLKHSVSSATLTYDVCFSEAFQWRKGGKLHGLGPLRIVSGGDRKVKNGWSARTNFIEDGRIQNYLYEQKSSNRFGFGSKSPNSVLKKGRWHTITYQLLLNSPELDNGRGTIFIDGELVIENKDIKFRGVFGEETRIHYFLFSTFHGGNDKSFSPKDKNNELTSVFAWFDNFVIKEGIVSPRPAIVGPKVCSE